MTDRIRPPWTTEQVDNLNAFQQSGLAHPFTCDREHWNGTPALVATVDGWTCPVEGCDYKQDWAHAFMVLRYCGCGSSTPLIGIDRNGRHRHVGYWQSDDEEPGGLL